LEAFAMLMPPAPTVREPPLMLSVDTDALLVPVLAELFTFMFSVPTVVEPPVMVTVELTGDVVCAVDPPPMELLAMVIVVMATVPPPMLRAAIARPLVVAVEAELTAMLRVPIVAEPVPPACMRLRVPVTLPVVRRYRCGWRRRRWWRPGCPCRS